MERRFKYLWDRQVVYRRDPITDTPSEETEHYMFYKEGTYQCYDLFRSKAKITSWRSFYWHMMVLWHLNPDWEESDVYEVATFLAYKPNGFTTFSMNDWNIKRVVKDLCLLDLKQLPRNKLRKVIFKINCGLTKSEKLSIVGKLIGRSKGVKKEDLYEAMIYKNHCKEKITIKWLAELLKVTPRTIHRKMCKELKQVKQELNEEIDI